jgi:hypothetical protein
VRTIPLAATAQGGVVRRGDVLLVGEGDFGAGMERVVRLDGGGETTIATGFNSLGGFDLDGAGTLYVVDNCAECAGATTGDTLFAIPDALTRTGSVTAAGHEVVPAGTIPTAADVLLVPSGAALVSDAAGSGAGRVVRVLSGVATDLITGLDLAGGIALAPDGSLRIVNAVLNPDFSTTGEVRRYGTDGTFRGTLVGGLAGGFGAASEDDGTVLVTGIGAFGASKVVAVAPDGSVRDRATGFSFSGDIFFDAARDEALVLDSGVQEITAICRDRDGDGVCDADEIACGDVNGDGIVNVSDALVVAQFDVGLRPCGEAPFTHPEACDVNGDGACNVGDALRIAQCDVGLISCTFTCRPFACQ